MPIETRSFMNYFIVTDAAGAKSFPAREEGVIGRAGRPHLALARVQSRAGVPPTASVKTVRIYTVGLSMVPAPTAAASHRVNTGVMQGKGRHLTR